MLVFHSRVDIRKTKPLLPKELLPDASHPSEIPLLSNPELILINGFYVDFLPILGQRSSSWEEVHWLLK